MTYASAIIVPRVREIRAKAVDFDDYARRLSALADEVFVGTAEIEAGSHATPQSDDLPELNLIARLESRISALERRVAELEAQK